MKFNRLTDNIISYYNECYLYYKIFWRSHKNLCLHWGFHDKGQSHSESLVRMIEILADKAKITSREKVLDAGCGVGGGALWLAKNIGCKVIGIDINSNFVNIAQREAVKRNLANFVSFHEMNFCQTTFGENEFDIVWAVESSCHAEDKQTFLVEMSRILKLGGRIIIADAYKTQECAQLNGHLSGWAVPNIPSVRDFKDYLMKAGFRLIASEDISDKVKPSSLRIYYLAWVASPLVMFLRLLRLKTELSINHTLLAFKQYSFVGKGLVKYFIFVAEKAA